ncbi:putative helicase helY domain protein [Mycobacterium kansasii 662]|uniref:Putative helicase helY domain protein n=1 Tax=Mycobacterium kansasii 662 TaxID=1299326 RepID=X7XPV2_MYCKA|nr:putative helicase helY domain protein [Mycobacterium kansasii 662]
MLTENRWAGRISSADYSGGAPRSDPMALPKRIEYRQPRVRGSSVGATVGPRACPRRLIVAARNARVRNPDLESLREQLRRHPCHPRWRCRGSGSPGGALPAHRTATTRSCRERFAAATNSLARTFDRNRRAC